jgi:hypothetical protein
VASGSSSSSGQATNAEPADKAKLPHKQLVHAMKRGCQTARAKILPDHIMMKHGSLHVSKVTGHENVCRIWTPLYLNEGSVSDKGCLDKHLLQPGIMPSSFSSITWPLLSACFLETSLVCPMDMLHNILRFSEGGVYLNIFVQGIYVQGHWNSRLSTSMSKAAALTRYWALTDDHYEGKRRQVNSHPPKRHWSLAGPPLE